MDKKDEKILVELLKNSRQPTNQLAKKVGVSREVADYRIKKLIEQKIITSFYSVIRPEFLGFNRSGCLVQLKNISSIKEREYFNEIIKHPLVTYVGPSVGRWNLIFDIFSKDTNHLSKTFQEVISPLKNYIDTYVLIQSITSMEHYPEKMLGHHFPITHQSPIKKLFIDEKDKLILKLISNNSRIDYLELSKKLRLTSNAIKYRIKALEKSGLISGYTIDLDYTKLGFEAHNIQVKLTDLDKESEVLHFLRNAKNVLYFYRHLGHENWDLDIGIIVRNALELRDFLIELRKNYGDFIKIHDIYANLEVLKPDIAPEGVFV